MKAACYSKHGGTEVHEFRVGYPMPKRTSGKVLVKIMAAGVNPVDYKLRRGDMPSISVPKPKIFGGDLAGIIVECDEKSYFKRGDKVFGMLDYTLTRWGTYAEYASVSESSLAHMPKDFSFAQAACMPLVSLTTLQAFRRGGIVEEEREKIKGRSILIHAGSGGVGSVAIQIAKDFGLKVFTTCSGKNSDYVKSLGADTVIDYKTQDFEEKLRDTPVDYVFDVIGAEVEKKSQRIIKKDKQSAYMTILTDTIFKQFKSWGWFQKPATYLWGTGHYSWKLSKQYMGGPRYSVTVVRPNGKDMEHIRKMMEKGTLKPQLGNLYTFEEYTDALEAVATGHSKGKCVIEICRPEEEEKKL
mmetsp:Transcript_26933/g.37463  ORF Transcript_26933/g.37463 Transcript_26933/m.37463 type:complete len:356 (-) Transcript_26933:123-1190(-)|eukprot:CAMPEP_0184486120 /NCGR_PEP_ID=MMETSP0113_2-20130426/7674_1 /TAXON_ID=91329 /ORGANISM="Norrisiella sphaerica, Strain BC52" /LENGTH=355 /DNA_ID=CAMNT_0026867861 /DNA_START=129 /DNA_END=1196 /DNA_ORIENTATION=-